MGVLLTGKDFGATEQVTSDKLEKIANDATFTSSAVDGSTTELTTGATPAIAVKDLGISTAKLANSGVTTAKIADANVTEAKIADGAITFAKAASSLLDAIYPIGSIYSNVSDSTNPGTLLGFGTWEAFAEGRVLVGVGTGTDSQPSPESKAFAEAEEGGEYNHTLTEAELASHTHTEGSNSETGFGTTAETASAGSRNSGSGTPSVQFETQSTGGDTAHNNIQPYTTVYMWKRTA